LEVSHRFAPSTDVERTGVAMAAEEEHDTYAVREHRDHLLQKISDSMTRESRAWTSEDAAVVLKRRIEHAGLLPMPEPWVGAVAAGVVRGEAYVVSPRTKEEMDVPAPRTRREPYGID
jgi:hypothetical protein